MITNSYPEDQIFNTPPKLCTKYTQWGMGFMLACGIVTLITETACVVAIPNISLAITVGLSVLGGGLGISAAGGFSGIIYDALKHRAEMKQHRRLNDRTVELIEADNKID